MKSSTLVLIVGLYRTATILRSRYVTECRAQVLKDKQGKRFVANFPPELSRSTQYGSSVKANAVYMSMFQLIPWLLTLTIRESVICVWLKYSKKYRGAFVRWKALKYFALFAAIYRHAERTGSAWVRHWSDYLPVLGRCLFRRGWKVPVCVLNSYAVFI